MRAERRGLFVVIAVLVVSAILGGIYGPNVRATTASADDYQTAVRDFTKVLDVVQANYAEPVDVDKAVYQGAIPGMLRMLDPHSNFFDARQFALLREDQRGKYYGVGMVVAPRDNHTVVMAPYVGAPAYNAGIRPGDVIVKVDEKSTDGLTTSDVADMLKGAKGTNVKITVTREGYTDPLDFQCDARRDSAPLRGHCFHAEAGRRLYSPIGLQRDDRPRNFRRTEEAQCRIARWIDSRHARQPGRLAQ